MRGPRPGAVGDAVNVAHRLGETAGAGELLIAAQTASEAGERVVGGAQWWEMRRLSVKGREEPVEAWSLRLAAIEAAT